MVFDREGYSPDFMVRMKAQHIAGQTYHQYPGEDGPMEAFFPREISLASGQVAGMNRAERGTWLAGKIGVREICKYGQSGRQTSVLSTNYWATEVILAGAMFARGSQGNFFKSLRENHNRDALVDYGTENSPDPPRGSIPPIGASMAKGGRKAGATRCQVCRSHTGR